MKEKVYSVTFMGYTNCIGDTVCTHYGESVPFGTSKYLDIGHEPFLVLESELEMYREYGGGYRSIQFVGNMEVGSG